MAEMICGLNATCVLDNGHTHKCLSLREVAEILYDALLSVGPCDYEAGKCYAHAYNRYPCSVEAALAAARETGIGGTT